MNVLPISTKLYRQIHRLAVDRRLVFMTGLPGVGKSLLIQQLALVAHGAGRKVHLLRYNDVRRPFESAEILASYPEVEGVTDPIIRKAVGVWSRQAIARWGQEFDDPQHLLIGELPLIGGRLIELVEALDDEAEPLLSGPGAEFVVPIPSWEVREIIEKTRGQTIASPRNEMEKLDAPPNVLRLLWEQVNQVARETGLTKARPDSPYNPYIYGGVYEKLLRYRPHTTLMIDEVLRPTKSVYDLEIGVSRLQPTAAEAHEVVKQVESHYPPDRRSLLDEEWHCLATSEAAVPDPGPQLRLPLPQTLLGARGRTALSDKEITALQKLLSLPLEASAELVLPILTEAIAILEENIPAEAVRAGVHKFDVYDNYFNVVRGDQEEGRLFLTGLLHSYGRVLENLAVPPVSLTSLEQPLLRLALESTVRLFLD